MGRCYLRSKNRFLYYYVSVSLMRLGDKFRVFFLNSLYFILFILYYCPKLDQ